MGGLGALSRADFLAVYPAGVYMADFKDLRESLHRRRAELTAELDRLNRTLLAINDAEKLLGDTSQSGGSQSHNTQHESPQRRVAFTPGEVSSIAREVLLERGRPLKRGALVRAIEEKGFHLSGKDKAKNLGTILWRHNHDFVHIEKFGYWPRDLKFGTAYDPELPPDGIFSPRLR